MVIHFGTVNYTPDNTSDAYVSCCGADITKPLSQKYNWINLGHYPTSYKVFLKDQDELCPKCLSAAIMHQLARAEL